MRVLILSASYGSGHNVAARSVAAALEAAGASVTIVDHFRDLVHPAFDRATRAVYAFMLRRAGRAQCRRPDTPQCRGLGGPGVT